MKRQLQIQHGLVLAEWTGTTGFPIPPDPSWTFVDVTDRPEATVGMTYDANTDTFRAPKQAAHFASAVDRLLTKTGA